MIEEDTILDITDQNIFSTFINMKRTKAIINREDTEPSLIMLIKTLIIRYSQKLEILYLIVYPFFLNSIAS